MVMAPGRGPADFQAATNPAMIGSPAVGTPPVDPQMQGATPFRMATLERAENVGQTSLQITTSEQTVENILPGTGFLYGIDLFVQNVTSANAATVAFFEDAPYSALSSIILADVNGEIVNVDGFSLEMAGRYGGWKNYAQEFVNKSGDANIWLLTAGAGGTGGSFTFHMMIPVSLNRRQLIGIVGNQDRSQQYRLRHNYASGAAAASGPIYTTAPTTQGTMTVTRFYESYAVPNAVNDTGRPNQVVPGHYGVIPYITKSVSEATPVGGSQVTHYLRRIGNVIRTLVLVLRSNGTRASAESNLPTSIQLKIGNETIFTESVGYRRHLMFNRYGFDAPQGVLCYDFIHDFYGRAGLELGFDWLWSQNLSQVQFLITYPAGFGSTNNSLTFITCDMIVPPGANVYGA